jgi:hypothetical protein
MLSWDVPSSWRESLFRNDDFSFFDVIVLSPVALANESRYPRDPPAAFGSCSNVEYCSDAFALFRFESVSNSTRDLC